MKYRLGTIAIYAPVKQILNSLQKLLLILCLGLTCLPGLSLAQTQTPEQKVRAAVDGLYQALGNSDAKKFSSYLQADGFTEWNPDWKGTRRLNLAVFEGIFSVGAKIDLHVDEMQVQLVGNTAVVTGYRVGDITPPGGKPISSRLALTMIWISIDGAWKLQHVHLSNESDK